MSSQESPPPDLSPLPESFRDSAPLYYWAMSYAPVETRLEGIRAAIAAGADLDRIDRGQRLRVGRPLHYAVTDMAMVDVNQLMQNLPIVELLLEAGADPRLVNRPPASRSPIEELEGEFGCLQKNYKNLSEQELGLYDFYEKALAAMKKVAERLDGECSV
jgi:hypothetical protein